jgi:hypothetical protein
MLRFTHVARAIVVFLTLFFVPGCSSEDIAAPIGIYAAACDPLVTIDIKPAGVAEINRNFCEGIGVEVWNYALEGDTIQFALEGKLGNPGTVHVEFRISSPTELTPLKESAFLTCNNCAGNEIWVKQ